VGRRKPTAERTGKAQKVGVLRKLVKTTPQQGVLEGYYRSSKTMVNTSEKEDEEVVQKTLHMQVSCRAVNCARASSWEGGSTKRGASIRKNQAFRSEGRTVRAGAPSESRKKKGLGPLPGFINSVNALGLEGYGRHASKRGLEKREKEQVNGGGSQGPPPNQHAEGRELGREE